MPPLVSITKLNGDTMCTAGKYQHLGIQWALYSPLKWWGEFVVNKSLQSQRFFGWYLGYMVRVTNTPLECVLDDSGITLSRREHSLLFQHPEWMCTRNTNRIRLQNPKKRGEYQEMKHTWSGGTMRFHSFISANVWNRKKLSIHDLWNSDWCIMGICQSHSCLYVYL